MMKVVLDLTGHWTLAGEATKKPIAAEVPGCVHTDLLQAGLIPDPYFRENENDLQWISEHAWTYTREFDVTAELLALRYVVLQCEGLDTLATIRINGVEVASTDNMFRRYEFEVSAFLRDGANTIEITFDSTLDYISERYRQRPLPTGIYPGAAYIRKEQCNFGWDWGPKLITCGIWKPIRIFASDDARIEDVLISQNHLPKEVVLEVDLRVANRLKGTTAEAELHFDGKLIVTACGVPGRSGRAKLSLSVKRPELWWPNGLGAQPLYDLAVTIKDSAGTCTDEWRRRIGLRTLDLRRKRDEWGESFEFVANGVPFFAKGANWIPADTFATRVTRVNYTALVRDAADANMNMLRVWGGGLYESDVFYDLCDEAGICVWQDFLFACSTYPTFDDAFLDNVEAEVRDNVARLRHHASLAVWCGNNELEQGFISDKWTDRTMSWKEYAKLFDRLIPDLLKSLDPQRPYWPGSPHSPHGNRADFNNPECGDAHLWEVWHGRQPFHWYRGARHRFASEFGFQSFPHPLTIESYTNPEDRNITSPVMEHHQRCGIGNTVIMIYMLDWFRMPKDFESAVWASQILQGIAIQTLVEQLRRNQPRSMGALYWQLNDCWPVASWSSIDGAGRWKALHYMARRFYAPCLVTAVADRASGKVDIHTNTEGLSGRAKLEFVVYTTSGREVMREARTVRLSANAARKCASISVGSLAAAEGERTLLIHVELSREGRILATNLETLVPYKQMELASGGSVKAKAMKNSSREFRVTLTTKKPAVFLWLSHLHGEARWSDNFLHLMPGHESTITATTHEPMTLRQFREGLQVRTLADTYC